MKLQLFKEYQPYVQKTTPSQGSSPPSSFQWAVIGAGPAGIAAVGLLLDNSVPPSSILWIDPSFSVGDFGSKWKDVSSNTTVGLFIKFYSFCKSFEYVQTGKYAIEKMDPKGTCQLKFATEPLRDITQKLRSKMWSVEGEVVEIKQKDSRWEVVTTTVGSLMAVNVILATGSVPNSLSLHSPFPHLSEISVVHALDPAALAASVSPDDTVAIFGSSHTAIILIRNLLETTKVKQIVNFYREPLKYAMYMKDWILFDDTGLKGDTARWSREHMHGNLPSNVTRILSNDENIATHLPKCTKVIYATGFSRRELKGGIEGLPPRHHYNPHCGILAPGLFGCGIAYPQQNIDRFGNVEYRVGLWKFMEYLNDVVPLWMQYNVLEGIGQPRTQ